MRCDNLPYERIRNLRIDKDLSQKELGKILNVAPNTLSQYETGVLNYPVEVLIKLADLHETSIDYMLNLTDEANPYPRKKNIG